MSDIRFNQWLHQSGTGGVTQLSTGHVGIGTTDPLIPVHAGNNAVLNVGVVTANSYHGSAANLTSIPAGQLTGTVADARISTLTASKLTGALPAISGANLTGITGTTINNNANNRVITGSGTANTLEGESTFTHDSTNYDTVISGSANAPMDLIIRNDHNSFTAAGARLTIQSGNEANTGPQEQMIVGSHSWLRQVPKSSGNMTLAKNGTTHTTFAATGDLTIGDGNLVVASGHGIDFSAAGNAGGMTSELLDDYEEGSWTPQVLNGWGILNPTYTENVGLYVKVGKIVHIFFRINLSGGSTNGNRIAVSGFPFTPATIGSTGYAALNGYCDSASSNAQSIFCMAGKSGTTAELFHRENTGESSFTGQELGNTGSFNFSGTYTT